jgi:AraC-like DNA-binding protein
VTRRAADFLKNRFDRRDLGLGAVEWIYEYRNRSPLPIPPYLSTGFELGVQLSGEWFHRGSRAGARLFVPGMVHTISPGERFWYAFAAPHEAGTLVGFTVYPGEAPELPRGLVFAGGVATGDARLFDLCRAMKDADARGERLPTEEIRGELVRFLLANCEATPHDALLEAKKALEEGFDRPLYLRHIASIAGMHPVTFSRKFIERFGLTPTRYRLELRINAAVRLAWSRRDMSIRDVAAQVGFEDVRYMHRVFVRKFGMTPSQIGRRACAA